MRVRSSWSPPQVNAWSTTTAFGYEPALSPIVEGEVGLGIADPVSEHRVRTNRYSPAIAFAYGSISTLAGLNRIAGLRLVQAVDTIAIELPGPYFG